jgi:uncharacterized protein involved in type VI secretion and phage assembly
MATIGAATDLAAGCKVTMGGPLDPALADNILEVRVETTVGLPDVCTIRFAEADPQGTGKLTVIDSPKFKLGTPVKVNLAKAVGGQPVEVFDGEITTVEAELGSSIGGQPALTMTVTAHDKSHKMHRKTTTRTFRQMTVVDIARKMAGENGLRVGQMAALQGGAAEERHQVGETDWEYLSRLVRAHGGELDVAAGAMNIIDPSKTKGPAAELVYGETLQRFRPRVSSLGQVEKVDVRGWDVTKKAALTATGTTKASTTVEDKSVKSVVAGSKALLAVAHVSTQAETKARAEAAAMQLGHERVQGTAVASGDPKLLAGEFVKLSGVGTRFAGTHRIVSAVHVYGARGYVTQLTLGAGGQPLAAVMAGGRSRQFGDSLVIGLVTDNSDPDKLGRVKVKYPLLNDEVESGWARIAWGAAGGKERGTVTIPHVNDEVAVGFEHGDVRRPILLGALFNGVDKPGTDLTKATSSLAARFPRDLDVETKEKIELTSGKDMTVTSKQGPIVVTAGKEMTLTASKGGPPSAITIETTGQIKATGKQGVEISAMGPLKITSTAPVTIESNAALQLKGTAIQVQASGILQLAGATVMIG